MCVKELSTMPLPELKGALASKIGQIVRTPAVHPHLGTVLGRCGGPECKRYGRKEDI